MTEQSPRGLASQPDVDSRAEARSGLLRRRVPLRSVGRDPDYRFSLANERTFLAWIRTSLALLAGGVAVVKLVPQFGPPSGRLALGLALVSLGFLVASTSFLRWARNERAIRSGRALPYSRIPPTLAIGLAAVALATVAFFVSGAVG
jgi:putative membrane protein